MPARVHPSRPESVPTCHVVGGGVAGLSAALRLAEAGLHVHLYEAAPHVGGRCRSLPDQRFGTSIDNGSHLLFSANRAMLDFLRRIGAPSTSLAPSDDLAFRDIDDGARWRITPSGESGLWLLGRGLRIPGASRWQLLRQGFSLLTARSGTCVGDRLPVEGALWRRFWRPFLVAAFNADPATVSAPHAATVLRELAFDGKAGGQPLQAARPWSEIIAEPAIARLRYHGASIHYGMPLLALDRGEGRVRRLLFRRGTIDTTQDIVILAVPNAIAHRLIPDIAPEIPSAAIVNLHYDIPLNLGLGFRGLVGGLVDWVFWRDTVVSVTIGGSHGVLTRADGTLARAAWAEAVTALPKTLSLDTPPCRRIVEKRATLATTPHAFSLRPGAATPHPNLFLAGDWTATGLPSTIEGAVLSGNTAAAAALAFAHEGL